MRHNRLLRSLGGPALILHQSVLENGLEAWRLLRKRYDPKTTLRNLQLWLKIMNPGKVTKSEGIFVQLNRWESWEKTLNRDRGRDVAETARVGLLIVTAPDELHGTIVEHAVRLQNCAPVKEIVVLLTPGADCTTPAPWTWDTLARTVTTGQSLVCKTRALALLDERSLLSVWRSGSHCKLLQHSEGGRRHRRGQREGTGRHRNRQMAVEMHCGMQSLWQTRT